MQRCVSASDCKRKRKLIAFKIIYRAYWQLSLPIERRRLICEYEIARVGNGQVIQSLCNSSYNTFSLFHDGVEHIMRHVVRDIAESHCQTHTNFSLDSALSSVVCFRKKFLFCCQSIEMNKNTRRGLIRNLYLS